MKSTLQTALSFPNIYLVKPVTNKHTHVLSFKHIFVLGTGFSRQFKTIQDNSGQFKTIQENSRKFKTIQNNSRPFKTIQQFKTIQPKERDVPISYLFWNLRFKPVTNKHTRTRLFHFRYIFVQGSWFSRQFNQRKEAFLILNTFEIYATKRYEFCSVQNNLHKKLVM